MAPFRDKLLLPLLVSLLLFTACDNSTSGGTDAGTSPESDPNTEALEGLDVDWENFGKHPARMAVKNCHQIDGEDFVLFDSFLEDGHFGPSGVAPLLGIEFEENNEFERKRKKEKIKQKIKERLGKFERGSLCVRRKIPIKQYDFDNGGFPVKEEAGVVPFTTPPAAAEDAINRLEEETGSEAPEDFQLPMAVLLGSMPRHLPVAETQAEELADSLPEIAEASTRDDKGDQADFRRKISYSVRMGGAAFRAARYAESVESDGEGENDSVAALFRKLDGAFDLTGEGRLIEVILVFDLMKFTSERLGWESVQKEIRQFPARLQYVVALDQAGNVVGVVPPADAVTDTFARGTIEEIDLDRHRTFVQAACPGRARTRTKTRMVDGALVDQKQLVCTKCPGDESSSSGTPKFERVAFGAFTAPGLSQVLVTYRGCEPESEGGGGAVLLERTARGQWLPIYYDSGDYRRCEIASVPSEPDIALCERETAGETSKLIGIGYYTRGTEVSELVSLIDNSETCADETRIAKWEGIEKSDGRLSLKFRVVSGVREKECEARPLAETKIDETIVIDIEPGEDGLSLKAVENRERIESVVKGEK